MSFLTLLPSGSSLYLIFIIGFFSLYKLVPNRKVNWIAALVSALYTASVWMIAKVAFGYYTSKVLTYSTIYGSLGAIPILLLWIYINWVVILSGAAIGSSLQQKYDLKE
jgi:membrane protein